MQHNYNLQMKLEILYIRTYLNVLTEAYQRKISSSPSSPKCFTLNFLKFLLETNMKPKSFLFRKKKKKTQGIQGKNNKLDFIKI